MRTTAPVRCPDCGNTDPLCMEDNHTKPSGMSYALLCTAKVPLADWAFRDTSDVPPAIDPEGRVVCGVQWCPNDQDEPRSVEDLVARGIPPRRRGRSS